MDDSIAREGTLARCNQDREATAGDAECINARRAASALAARADEELREQREASSDVLRAAVRDREGYAQAAVRRAEASSQVAADADFEMSWEAPVPPAVLWQYFVDPDKSVRWLIKADPFVAKGRETTSELVFGHRNTPNSRGRLGVGAIAHCEHGASDMLHRYVDWRPFKYFTRELAPVKRSFFRPPITETTEFLPREGGGTVLHHRIRFQNRGRLFQLLVRLMAALSSRRTTRLMEANLTRLLEEDGWLDRAADRTAAEEAE
ncbi:MAG: hypothetical protein IH797_04255 [Chloroflexi bacterium]|nr:hypothetical protein [Chloroflexota bacterium]